MNGSATHTTVAGSTKPGNMEKALYKHSRVPAQVYYTNDLPRDPARYVKQEKQEESGYRPRTLHPHQAWYADRETLKEMILDPALVHFFDPVGRPADVERGYFGRFCGAPIITNAGSSERDKAKDPTGLYVVDMSEPDLTRDYATAV